MLLVSKYKQLYNQRESRRLISDRISIPIKYTFLLIMINGLCPSFSSEPPLSQICLSDHSTDATPTFIVKKTVCNYLGSPVKVYSFEKKAKPVDKYMEYCILGKLMLELTIIDIRIFSNSLAN